MVKRVSRTVKRNTRTATPEDLARSGGTSSGVTGRGSPVTIAIRQVDVFTSTPLTGNPAAVVLDGNGLSEDQMQCIAREMALSETVFLLRPTTTRANLRIRWFTPKCEVRICGHATIAAFHVLAEEEMFGMKRVGTYRFAVETLSGVLPVTVERSPDSVEILFGLPLPTFERMSRGKLDLLRILKVGADDLESRFAVVNDGEHIYVPLKRLHTVFALKPDTSALAAFLDARKHSGLCAFTTETIDRRSHVHSRFFAPNVGIPEDPVTGSSNGPLGVYLAKYTDVASGRSDVTLIGEQGDEIGRRGRVTIRVTLKGSEPTGVSIGGRAVTVMNSEMIISGH